MHHISEKIQYNPKQLSMKAPYVLPFAAVLLFVNRSMRLVMALLEALKPLMFSVCRGMARYDRAVHRSIRPSPISLPLRSREVNVRFAPNAYEQDSAGSVRMTYRPYTVRKRPRLTAAKGFIQARVTPICWNRMVCVPMRCNERSGSEHNVIACLCMKAIQMRRGTSRTCSDCVARSISEQTSPA